MSATKKQAYDAIFAMLVAVMLSAIVNVLTNNNV